MAELRKVYPNVLMSSVYMTALACGMFLTFGSTAASAGSDIDPLFASDEILDVRIEAPFAMLTRERPDEEEAQGTFSYRGADGELVKFDIQVRTRGRLRRGKKTCSFPPFRLNFRKSEVADSLFDKQDKLKLVSHCRSSPDQYEQAVISEYLTYRIYNLLTERSFHARLLRATYVYSDKNNRTETGYAIIIEHKDRLSKRLDATTVNSERISINSIAPEDLNLTSVFQYFIGNTDFSPVASAPNENCCHNQVVFVRQGELDYTVPYDFDQSGLVNAPYAMPNPRFKLRNVRERLYRGRCMNNGRLPATLGYFREKRRDIEALIKNQQGLDNKTRRSMLQYVGQFYKTIDNPKSVDRQLISKCLN